MKELLDHYDGLIVKLRRDYRLTSEYFDSVAVHELRVDIKRLRALLAFAGSLRPGNRFLATQDRFEKLFKRAGKLRHFQLLLELTKRHMDELGLRLDSYFNFLKQNELRERKRYREFCRKFDQHFLERNRQRFAEDVAEQDGAEIPKRLLDHFHGLLSQLRGARIESNSLPETYHAVRILAKETRYSLEMLRKCSEPNATYDELDRLLMGLHQALGAWHDFDLAAADLQQYVSQCDLENIGSPESFSRFAAALSTERDLQLELFRARWLDFGIRHSEVEFASVSGE